ncbi:MAG: acyl carrier protein [Myxococcota bacterium]
MTRDEIRAAFLEALSDVAPEVDVEALEPDAPLRDEVDLDSVDFLQLLRDLRDRLGVEVPEQDYDRLRTLDSTVDYLRQRSGETEVGEA